MAHDFNRFPELTNAQMDTYYFESPHKQIVDDFRAKVVKVHDGDTVTIEADFRDFTFPVRISNLAAPELNEGGAESQKWLENRVLGKEVDIIVSKARVEKWGRLLADIMQGGELMSEAVVMAGQGVAWEDRAQNQTFGNFEKELVFL